MQDHVVQAAKAGDLQGVKPGVRRPPDPALAGDALRTPILVRQPALHPNLHPNLRPNLHPNLHQSRHLPQRLIAHPVKFK